MPDAVCGACERNDHDGCSGWCVCECQERQAERLVGRIASEADLSESVVDEVLEAATALGLTLVTKEVALAAATVAATTAGVTAIAVERDRQVTDEGWTAAHDDQYVHDELAMAAATYALPPGDREVRWFVEAHGGAGQPVDVERPEWVRPARACFEWQSDSPRTWPLPDAWFKPSADRIRELAKAGALIAAEIDRTIRAAAGGDSA